MCVCVLGACVLKCVSRSEDPQTPGKARCVLGVVGDAHVGGGGLGACACARLPFLCVCCCVWWDMW